MLLALQRARSSPRNGQGAFPRRPRPARVSSSIVRRRDTGVGPTFIAATALAMALLAGEITARINETSFAWLDAPVLRVTAHDVPLPYAPSLEDFVLPQTADIVRAARTLAAY